MNWLKKLLKAKITINIIISTTPDVKHTTEPVIINENNIVNKVLKSDFRFVSEHKTDFNGVETLYYFTEQYEHKYKRWSMVSNSFTSDKSVALDRHVLLVNTGSLEPKTVKTVHWEGLSKEETEAWVILNK